MKLARNFVSAVALTASILLTIGSNPARANTPAPVFGTGVGSLPGGRDSNWKVVAGPLGVPGYTAPENYPYNSFTLLNAPGFSPGGGTPQTGVVVNGTTYYWTGPTSDSGVSEDLPIANWIFAQEFTITSADNYDFNFLGGADNALVVYIGGTVVNNSEAPVIQNPIAQLFQTSNNVSLDPIFNSIFLEPDTYTLYALLQNAPAVGPTGFLLANNNTNGPVNDVPAPLPLFGVAAAFGASRRLKRRIRLARPAATAGVGQSAPERV